MSKTLQYSALAPRSYVSGAAQPVDLLRGVKTHALLFGLDFNVTITGSSGGSVMPEGTQNLISRIRLIENGVPRVDIDGSILAFVTSLAQMQAANVGKLAAATAGTSSVHADFVLEFASVFGGNPTEIAFIERDSRFPTQVEITFAADPNATLISGTGLVLNSATVSITQVYDPKSTTPPFFLPRITRAPGGAITGTQTAFPLFLYPESGNRLAGTILHSVVDGATSDSVLNGNVTFRGDTTRYIDTIPALTLLNEERRQRPSIVPRLGYLWLNDRWYGKLSEMWVSGQDQNLRYELGVTNPGTNAKIDVFMFQMEPVPGYTRQLPAGW